MTLREALPMAESRYGMTASLLSMLYNINCGEDSEFLPPAAFNPYTAPEPEQEENPEIPPAAFLKIARAQG